MKKRWSLAASLILGTQVVSAHCPLCTIGAAAAAGGATALGVSHAAIGVFIGAFAVSMGWWFGNALQKRYIPYQKPALIVLSFVTTVLPMKPFLADNRPLYLSWLGTYGTTFSLDVFLICALLGGLVVTVTPSMSRKITAWRDGKLIPYQGLLLTMGLLLVVGTVVQLVA
ncbi:hypothetical protein D6789_00465 [Candidatus Woesearchaeota archaeon]|nr:MAG: hypothetical protein D6789_00465 [Candidatus Woesearchaeota archaeon]